MLNALRKKCIPKITRDCTCINGIIQIITCTTTTCTCMLPDEPIHELSPRQLFVYWREGSGWGQTIAQSLCML